MAIKPILFSGPMVRAILDGNKTQTRRVVKLDIARDNRFPIGNNVVMNIRDPKAVEYAPYQKGDVLWVRETFYEAGYSFRTYPEDDEWSGWHRSGLVWYAVDGVPPVMGRNDWGVKEGFHERCKFTPVCGEYWWRKRPSIFMPKKHCRIFLKITNVRAEWLRDLSHEDALSEGIVEQAGGFAVENPSGGWIRTVDPVQTFSTLWDSLNAKRGFGWDVSPWVWVYEFERTDRPADFLKAN